MIWRIFHFLFNIVTSVLLKRSKQCKKSVLISNYFLINIWFVMFHFTWVCFKVRLLRNKNLLFTNNVSPIRFIFIRVKKLDCPNFLLQNFHYLTIQNWLDLTLTFLWEYSSKFFQVFIKWFSHRFILDIFQIYVWF